MRKILRIALFNLVLVALLLGLVWLTQGPLGQPGSVPTAAPTSFAQSPVTKGPVQGEPTVPSAGPDPTDLATPEGEPTLVASPTVDLGGGLVQEAPGDLVLDPGDPFYNDAPTQTLPVSALITDVVNPRHAHLTFEFVFSNDGPGDVTSLDVYVAIPASRDSQRITDLTFSAAYEPLADRYGQEMAHFNFVDLAPGQQATISWEGDVEVEAMDYRIDPAQVAELDQIPSDILELYTTNETKYRLESGALQSAARTAAGGATNPYWIARNVHDYVARRLTYFNDGQWDDADTVYRQRNGSCSEYSFLYISLCRANGVPARYVAGTRQRKEGTYVDTLFHRWTEVYLPPYGWVPVDALHDDWSGGIRYDYFGAISDERFATTVNGGDSEYLGWNYHYGYRFEHEGERPEVTRERRFIWEPYPSELRVSPDALSGFALPDTVGSLIGRLGIVTTNGSHEWAIGSATSWLRLDEDSGKTPGVVHVFADTTGLELGSHNGELMIESGSLDASWTIPVEVVVVEEIPTPVP